MGRRTRPYSRGLETLECYGCKLQFVIRDLCFEQLDPVGMVLVIDPSTDTPTGIYLRLRTLPRAYCVDCYSEADDEPGLFAPLVSPSQN